MEMKKTLYKLIKKSTVISMCLGSSIYANSYYAHIQPVNPSNYYGAQNTNSYNYEYYNDNKSVSDRLNMRQKHLDTVRYDQNHHDNINATIAQLADRLLMSSRIPYNRMGDIAVTSFVDLHQLNKTTHFGRTVGETMFDELFVRGFNVTDFRGQSTISVNANGEYFLSRDVNLLRNNIQNQYILVGTYSKFNEDIIVNARIIDNINGTIVASARSSFVTNDCRILENCPATRKIKIITDGCSTVGCPPKSCPTGICENDKYNISHHKPERRLTISKANSECLDCDKNVADTLSNVNNEYKYLDECKDGENCENKVIINNHMHHSKSQINQYQQKNNYTLSLVK